MTGTTLARKELSSMTHYKIERKVGKPGLDRKAKILTLVNLEHVIVWDSAISDIS